MSVTGDVCVCACVCVIVALVKRGEMVGRVSGPNHCIYMRITEPGICVFVSLRV